MQDVKEIASKYKQCLDNQISGVLQILVLYQHCSLEILD
jgi:hypothetical protein